MSIPLLQTIQFLSLFTVITALSGLFSAFAPMTSRKEKCFYLLLTLGILAFLTMFHSLEVGNDTDNYVLFFLKIGRMNLGHAMVSSRFEPGFILYSWLLSRLTTNPQILFAVTGLVFYLLLGRWIMRHIESPGLFVCLIVATLSFDSWLCIIRQTLAVGILLVAYDYLEERRLVPFTVAVLIASSFHMAALVFFLAYPAVYCLVGKPRKGDKKPLHFTTVVLCNTLIVLVFLSPVLNLLISIFPQYSYYLGGSYLDGRVRLATVLDTILYILMLVLPRAICRDKLRMDTYWSKDNRIPYRLSILHLVFCILSFRATLLTRLCSLFTPFMLQDYNRTIQLQRLRDNRTILVVVSLMLFAVYGLVVTLLRTPEWFTTYPFSLCW